jgi:neurabin
MGVGADSGLEKLGIFVKSLNPQGVIARDGRYVLLLLIPVEGSKNEGGCPTYL